MTDSTEQRAEETNRLLRDIFKQLANPAGRPLERITNRLVNFMAHASGQDALSGSSQSTAFTPTTKMWGWVKSLTEAFGGKTVQEQGKLAKQVSAVTSILNATHNPDEHLAAQKLKQDTSPLSQMMTAFADFMGVPKTDDQNIVTQGEEKVSNAIGSLTSAVEENTNALLGTPSAKKNTQGTSSSDDSGDKDENPWLTKMLSGAAWIGKKLQPIGNLIPKGIRDALQSMGQNAATNLAGRMGVSPAVAGRFGAAIGMAAPPVMALMGIATIAKQVALSLKKLADEAFVTTQKLAHYSASLAYGSALLEQNRKIRDIGKAGNIAEGGMFRGAERFEAKDKLEEALEPFSTAVTILGNDIGTSSSLVLSGILEGINNLLTFAAKGVELLDEKGGKAGEIAAMIVAGGIPVGEILKNVWGDPAKQNKNEALWPGWDKMRAENNADIAARMRGPRLPGGEIR